MIPESIAQARRIGPTEDPCAVRHLCRRRRAARLARLFRSARLHEPMADDILIKDRIRQVPDFPKPGILFYDISTLLADAEAWRATVHQLTKTIRPLSPDLLVGIESRGFLVSAPLAFNLGCGFVMVRKKGK